MNRKRWFFSAALPLPAGNSRFRNPGYHRFVLHYTFVIFQRQFKIPLLRNSNQSKLATQSTSWWYQLPGNAPAT